MVRKFLEKQGMSSSTETLFYNPNDLFSARGVFVSGDGVEVDTEITTDFAKTFKFSIDENVGDGELLGSVDGIHLIQCQFKIRLLT